MEIITGKIHAEQKALVERLRRAKRNVGLNDFYFFCKFILGYEDMEEQPHRGMCNFISQSWRRKLVLEPRGCFKSTVISISYPIYKIVMQPNIRVFLDSEDLTLAKKLLSEIKGHFENNREFRKLFGDYCDGAKSWTETQIIVNKRTKDRKDPTIQTGGIETPRTGSHTDLNIVDDLHSDKNVNTIEQIEKVINHRNLNDSILDPGGEEIVTGTRWAVGDMYEHLMKQEKERRKAGLGKIYVVRKRAAIYEDGSLHFPTRLTKEFLEEKKFTQGSRIFALQYMNNPIDEDAVLFKPKWIQYFGIYEPARLITNAVLDPAISQKAEACNTAFTHVGWDEDGYGYILDAVIQKIPPEELVDWMIRLQSTWKPQNFGVETVTFQKFIKFWAWERMRQTGVWINIVELRTDTDVSKDMRIKQLIPLIESGSMRYRGTSQYSLKGGLRQLYDEMTAYPMTAVVDGLDSLAYHLQLHSPPSVAKRPQQTSAIPTIDEMFKSVARPRNFKSKCPIIGHGRKLPHSPIIKVG